MERKLAAIFSADVKGYSRLMGDNEEAIPILKRVITRSPDHLPAYADLAVLYSELGREEGARAEAAEVLKVDPNFSLEVAKQTWPFNDQMILEHWLDALRKAGLK